MNNTVIKAKRQLIKPQYKPKGGLKVIIEKHKYDGVFIARSKQDALCTKNLIIGFSVYGEKRIIVKKTNDVIEEYRVWNPFRSKLAAVILGGVDDIFLRRGMTVLYLGAANGTTVSHISDIVGTEGTVYAVEFSHRSGRDLLGLAKKRTNIVPIIEDARYPYKYRMLLGITDLVFSDVAQPDQARILSINSKHFLKTGGYFIIAIKASCIDSIIDPNIVFTKEVQKLVKENFKPSEQITLEPYERDHAVVLGRFKVKKQ
mmetsp:Transcript_17484/g.39591  ORF Transcript_17484/g.39591 Transcript_17484/m.39591 type:complete len:259 (+) Transcript_17484:125-901(+)